MVWEKPGRGGGRGEEEGGGREERRERRGLIGRLSKHLAYTWIHTVERRHIETPTFIQYAASIRATRMCSRRTGWKTRAILELFLQKYSSRGNGLSQSMVSLKLYNRQTSTLRCEEGIQWGLGAREVPWSPAWVQRYGPYTSQNTWFCHTLLEHSLFELVGITVGLYLWAQPTVSQKYSRKKAQKDQNTDTKWICCKSTLLSPWGNVMSCTACCGLLQCHRPQPLVCVLEYWTPWACLWAVWLGSNVHTSTDLLSLFFKRYS